jgi:hypothetical protein
VITLEKVKQTCQACPSQWDAWDADGRYYYLRYRHGRGTVERFPNPEPTDWGHYETDRDHDQPFWVSHAEYYHEFRAGDSLDGLISLEDFISHCPDIEVAPAAVLEPYNLGLDY